MLYIRHALHTPEFCKFYMLHATDCPKQAIHKIFFMQRTPGSSLYQSYTHQNSVRHPRLAYNACRLYRDATVTTSKDCSYDVLYIRHALHTPEFCKFYMLHATDCPKQAIHKIFFMQRTPGSSLYQSYTHQNSVRHPRLAYNACRLYRDATVTT